MTAIQAAYRHPGCDHRWLRRSWSCSSSFFQLLLVQTNLHKDYGIYDSDGVTGRNKIHSLSYCIWVTYWHSSGCAETVDARRSQFETIVWTRFYSRSLSFDLLPAPPRNSDVGPPRSGFLGVTRWFWHILARTTWILAVHPRSNSSESKWCVSHVSGRVSTVAKPLHGVAA